MRDLSKFLLESVKPMAILEGGAAGHLAHVIDFGDFTAKNLKELVEDMFLGKIEDITEKIDGLNLQATINQQGEVVFIRNGGDIKSERGGMTITDMATKWATKPGIADTYVSAGKIIQVVFNKIGTKFFNPDPDTRIVANCECVNAGQTNIIPYANACVSFHDIWTYKLVNNEWVVTDVSKKGLDVIEKACEGLDNAKPTPKVIVKLTDDSNNLIKKYHDMIDDLFEKDENMSIDAWKRKKFSELLEGKWSWIKNQKDGVEVFYDRWFNNNKRVNLRDLKKLYPENAAELDSIEKSQLHKDVIDEIVGPLENIFLKLGNDVIKLCDGLLNGAQNDSVILKLQAEMKQVVKDVKTSGSPKNQAKLIKQLTRLDNLGGDQSINSVEGIVFKHKGRLMKLTGSFAPLNQILGTIKFSK